MRSRCGEGFDTKKKAVHSASFVADFSSFDLSYSKKAVEGAKDEIADAKLDGQGAWTVNGVYPE
ncbi:uncharacterized protein FOMMEDRAFT_151712 [Fomitiporia mediterranea MF3/22]|uniref:uncharacterized protein n=1 Tax=Fomitiporia mediterranea (strain MF3/22) TaxID=694068 RepID=UPI0004407B6F|nr:uncharacterized protein FOMMEDRAFT_151712 [Fomitiporia mediterranea MF3/22]EJD06444.1 hypothetical protein FOMMEDRAFT_151712 [Fomitiporia mediterranea MF3/22]